MIVLGLTGSIGMGKSTTAGMFRTIGIPTYDADGAVHELYEPGGAAVGPLSRRFPPSLVDGAIDRSILRELVIGDPHAMADLEKIVHPLVGQTQIKFREKALESEEPLIVLDIPLLFETGGDQYCDYVAVVSAPALIQRKRVLSRNEMSEEEFDAILRKQTPDAEKRSRADFVISTAFGLDFTESHVRMIVNLLANLKVPHHD
ncbi:MAG: dephospho-CoA kinase [Pseudomonadota bacterium]